MVIINMKYNLNCDSCDYEETAVVDERADALAKQHESEHGDHFVLIETTQ